MAGYYRMARGWLDHPALQGNGEPYDRRSAWCWLIEYAAWKRHEIEIAGKTVHLGRGQLSHSTRHLSRVWGWTDSAVRRFLKRLKSDGLIYSSADAGQNVVTIRKYNEYQADAGQGDAPPTHPPTRPRRETDAGSDAGSDAASRPVTDCKEEEIWNGDLLGDAAGDAGSDADVTQQRRSNRRNKKKNRKEGKEGKDSTVASLLERQTANAFDEFWSVYPSRSPHTNPKKTALSKFNALVKKGTPSTDLIRGARNYSIYAERHIDVPKHIKQAVNWLGDELWHDYQDPPAPIAANGSRHRRGNGPPDILTDLALNMKAKL